MRLTLACFLCVSLLATPSRAEPYHPAMTAEWWIHAGGYLAARDFDASASASIGGVTREIDFERTLGLDDSPEIFMAELGWQFGENWGVALQHFNSARSASRVLDESFEWQNNLYEVGVRLEASTGLDVTRIFLARRFGSSGPHSFRLGAGIHWLDLTATVAGQARVNDTMTEYRRSTASASLPIPNVGAWYSYSPNDKWLIGVRADWLSASVDDWSGEIWNVSGGVNYRLWDHIGVGARYQYFQLSGRLTEDNWRGKIRNAMTGPYLHVTVFW